MLKKLIRKAGPVLLFSEHMDAADGERMFRHACALGLEGIVSKRLDKPYSSCSTPCCATALAGGPTPLEPTQLLIRSPRRRGRGASAGSPRLLHSRFGG